MVLGPLHSHNATIYQLSRGKRIFNTSTRNGGYRANTTRMAVSRATDIARSEGNGPLLAQVGAEADLLELVGLGEDLG